jgi:hypothetical protein
MTPNPADDGTGAAPAPGAARKPPSPAVAWREIGRAEHGDPLWIMWIGFADGRGPGGDALYRSLIVADDAIAVAVEREPPSDAGAPRPVHRGWCGPPPPDDARGVEERAAPLLAAADEAVARAVTAVARGRDRTQPGTGAQPDAG